MFDSNRYTVFGLLTRMGCEVIDLGVIPDEPDALEAAFVRAAEQSDAIITSGGVSVGEADYTKAMMKKLGDVAFWKIAMRPGRPMAVGQIFREKLASSAYASSEANYAIDSTLSNTGKAILFGLPGNPVAVMVTFLAFVRPALLQMMGAKAEPLPLLKGPQPGAHSQEARPHRVPARLRQHGGAWRAVGQNHRQPGLGRAQFHGAGQWPDRAAPRPGQRRPRRRGGCDDVQRGNLGRKKAAMGATTPMAKPAAELIFGARSAMGFSLALGTPPSAKMTLAW